MAAAAGCVDVLGYLLLFHLFAAHMTGNTVKVSASFSQGDWRGAWHSLLPVPLFILGAMLGSLVRDGAKRRRLPPRAVVLMVEVVLLAIFLAVGYPRIATVTLRQGDALYYVLAALATLAMGMQNAVPTHYQNRSLGLTYVTGTLAHLGDGLAGWWGSPPGERRDRARRRASVCGAVWLAYAGAAGVVGYLETLWGSLVVLIPIGCLTLIIGIDAYAAFVPPSGCS